MTPDNKSALEHDVIDADAWDEHQRAHFIKKHGVEEGTRIADANLAAKVKRIEEKTNYLSVKDTPGYKNRAARQADEDARLQAEMSERLAQLQAAESANEQKRKDEIAVEVKRQLDALR